MTSAIEKRDSGEPPRVEVLKQARGPAHPAGAMLISSPREIDAVLRRIPTGKVLRLEDLRKSLAKSHKADYACPLTTGIFLGIVAEAAEEERAAGVTPIAPYWRVVRDDGELIDKLPGGKAAQAERLASEKVEVFRLGTRAVIADLEGCAWSAPPLGSKAHRAAEAAEAARKAKRAANREKKR